MLRRVLVLALAVLASARPAEACGPDFPPELLFDRAGTLADLPDGAFSLEAKRLVPRPSPRFVPVEDEPPKDARTGGGEKERALYEEGAEAYRRGELEAARAAFTNVLALPEAERRRFSSFAAFMLGRLATEKAAAARFEETRALVEHGFDDPLGLAVASFGEQARLALEAGDDVEAVHLYAAQAAAGSQSGTASLLILARRLASDQARARRALADPVVQRLLAAYAWTRGAESWWGPGEEEHRPGAWLVDLLESIPKLAGADRLAAAAYRAGGFDRAERFAREEDTPLASWVLAKLALRRGDAEEAERRLARAAEGFNPADNWVGPYQVALRPLDRVEAERAVLALARADFRSAFARTLDSCSWPDVAYVGERVLAIDELRAVVDARAAAPGPKGRCDVKPNEEGAWAPWAEDFEAQLRAMLARRLLRAGRDQEALPYFRDAERTFARELVEARRRAASSKGADKAEALFLASKVARVHGLEVLGTEVGPDWAWTGAEFDLGQWHEMLTGDDGPHADQGDASDAGTSPDAGARTAAISRLAAKTSAEDERVRASAPPSPRRFHYRETASALAEEAAEAVPKRSQAYFALLCHAGRYVATIDPERTTRLWKRYVREGAYVPGPWSFGGRCPDPDFERLRHPKSKLVLPWKKYRKRTLALVLAPVALCGAAVVLVLRRRRLDPGAGDRV